MADVRVGIFMPLDPALVKMIEEVSPRIEIRELAPLVSEAATSDEAKAKLDEELRHIEVLYFGGIPEKLAARSPDLKWAQYVGTGVEGLFKAGLVDAHFAVTNASGTNAQPIAEHCFMFMMMFMKQMPQWAEEKANHAYRRGLSRSDFIEGKTVGILGLGGIGLEVARLGQAFRMRVLAVRRGGARQSGVGDVDEMYPPSGLQDMLRESDFVVVALPLTAETERIIGEAELRAMKPTAYIINIGRGKLIDEAAMVRALKDNVIAGAGLDVFEVEPLPKESGLWDMPNVLMTPHVSGGVVNYRERTTKLFCENLRHYLAGEPLENLLDSRRGY